MIIENVVGSVDDYNLDEYNVDKIILDHDELIKPHQKQITENGREIAISLPHGEQLYYGAVLYEDDKDIIVVVMADEELLEIFPDGNIQWGRAAFNIGNMHHPAYLNETSIVTPYDPSIERIFKALNMKYERKTGKLTGQRANVNQVKAHDDGHPHSHSHSHRGDDNE